MQTKSQDEVANLLRPLIRDCLQLCEDSKLPVGDLATILGTSRVSVYKWRRSLPDGWKNIDVSGNLSTTVFLNLIVVKRNMELAFANGELPAPNRSAARRWVTKAFGSIME